MDPLRRIETQIGANHQEIARLQIDNARLEMARQVLIGLDRKDDATDHLAGAGKMIANGKPAFLTVRKAADGRRSQKGKRRPGSALNLMRGRVTDALKRAGHSMTSLQIGDALGLDRNEASRKSMSNALYQLKKDGELVRDEVGRYGLAPAQEPVT
jgi:hypothetical protein